jgi:hypothetical protein
MSTSTITQFCILLTESQIHHCLDFIIRQTVKVMVMVTVVVVVMVMMVVITVIIETVLAL